MISTKISCKQNPLLIDMAKQIKKSKVLRLVLKKKWFDMLSNGKKEEYREIKPYWIRRLVYSILPEEHSGENSNIPDDFYYDITWNGHDPKEVFKAYYSVFRTFEWVELSLGYQKERPVKLAKVKRIRIGKPKAKWCEPEDVGKWVFVIELEML